MSTNEHPAASKRKLQQDSKPALPVDHGWAWAVMVANFANQWIAISFVRALAILFPVLIQRYKRSVAFTTLAFGMAEIMESIANILIPTIFLARFSVRTLTVSGAALHALSIMGLAFVADNIVLTNVCFGSIGLARGFMLNPQVFALGCYFKRRLSFASACANMGVSAATLFSPLVTRVMQRAYELEWTFLLIGAFSLNAVAASLLFRPASMYRESEEESSSKGSQDWSYSGATNKSDNDYQEEGRGDYIDKKSIIVSVNGSQTMLMTMNAKDSDIVDKAPYGDDGDQNVKDDEESSLLTMCESKICTGEDLTDITYQKQSCPHQQQSPSHCHQQTLETSLRRKQNQTHSTNRLHQQQHQAQNRNFRCFRLDAIREWIRRALTNSICSKPAALLLIIASGLGVHTQAGNVYLPVLGLENGLTEDQLPWLLTITGSTDIVGKLLIGLLADRQCLAPVHIAILTQIVSGISIMLAHAFLGMAAMCVLSALYGSTAGILHVLIPTLTKQMVGLSSLPAIVSGYFLFNCLVTFVMHLAVGGLRDLTGSFVPGFRFVASLFLASVAVLIVLAVVYRFKVNKARGLGSRLGKPGWRCCERNAPDDNDASCCDKVMSEIEGNLSDGQDRT